MPPSPAFPEGYWLPNRGVPPPKWPRTSVQSGWQSIWKSPPRDRDDIIWNKFEFWEPKFPSKDGIFRILDRKNSRKVKFHHWDRCFHQWSIDILNPEAGCFPKQSDGLSREWMTEWQWSKKPWKDTCFSGTISNLCYELRFLWQYLGSALVGLFTTCKFMVLWMSKHSVQQQLLNTQAPA